jgi:hypothetical protein
MQALAWCEINLQGVGNALAILRHADGTLRGEETPGSTAHKQAVLQFYAMEVESTDTRFTHMAGMLPLTTPSCDMFRFLTIFMLFW